MRNVSHNKEGWWYKGINDSNNSRNTDDDNLYSKTIGDKTRVIVETYDYQDFSKKKILINPSYKTKSITTQEKKKFLKIDI